MMNTRKNNPKIVNCVNKFLGRCNNVHSQQGKQNNDSL